MAKKLKSIIVPRILTEKGLTLFSQQEFIRLFGVSKTAATFFLFNHCRSGLFVKLKNGLYALSNPFPSEEEIANRLYQPSYISFETVLAKHGIIPESVYPVISATTKPSRQFEVEGKQYIYHTIKKEAYTGYHPQKIGNRLVLIASPEKAVVDTLYFVHLKKKTLNDRLDLSPLSKKRILDYAKIFKRPRFIKMIKELL